MILIDMEKLAQDREMGTKMRPLWTTMFIVLINSDNEESFDVFYCSLLNEKLSNFHNLVGLFSLLCLESEFLKWITS